eukprot:403345147
MASFQNFGNRRSSHGMQKQNFQEYVPDQFSKNQVQQNQIQHQQATQIRNNDRMNTGNRLGLNSIRLSSNVTNVNAKVEDSVKNFNDSINQNRGQSINAINNAQNRNEWGQLIQNQVQVYDRIKEDTKIYQEQLKKVYADELKTAEEIRINKQKEEHNLEYLKDKQTMILLDQQNQNLKQWQNDTKKHQQKQLYDEYGLMHQVKHNQYQEQKYIEKTEEQRRIQAAQISLEQEKIRKQQKLDAYKTQLEAQLKQKTDQNSKERLISHDIKNQDITNMHQYSLQQLNNEYQYRNQFVKKEEIMKNRQQQYQEQVMSPQMHKDFLINHTINKREQDYNQDLDQRDIQVQKLRQAMSEDRHRIVMQQVSEKEQQRKVYNEKLQEEVQERLKHESDYKRMLAEKKNQKLQQQIGYQSILESQIKQKQKQGNDKGLMSESEKQINRSNAQGYEIQPIPGQISINKYHTAANPSPRDASLDNEVPNLLLDDHQNIMMKKVLPKHFGNQDRYIQNYSPLSKYDGSHSVSNKPAQQIDDYLANGDHSKTFNKTSVLKSKGTSDRHNFLNSSLQDAAQLQLNMVSPQQQIRMSMGRGAIGYNPITNPIPLVNQNPYINRGMLDVSSNVRVRGKIIKTNDNNNLNYSQQYL